LQSLNETEQKPLANGREKVDSIEVKRAGERAEICLIGEPLSSIAAAKG